MDDWAPRLRRSCQNESIWLYTWQVWITGDLMASRSIETVGCGLGFLFPSAVLPTPIRWCSSSRLLFCAAPPLFSSSTDWIQPPLVPHLGNTLLLPGILHCSFSCSSGGDCLHAWCWVMWCVDIGQKTQRRHWVGGRAAANSPCSSWTLVAVYAWQEGSRQPIRVEEGEKKQC